MNLIAASYSGSSQLGQSGAAKENHFGQDACHLFVDSYFLISSIDDFVIAICSFDHCFCILLCTALSSQRFDLLLHLPLCRSCPNHAHRYLRSGSEAGSLDVHGLHHERSVGSAEICD